MNEKIVPLVRTAEDAPFTVGDQVILKSGGPALTVCSVDHKRTGWWVTVKWIDSSDVMAEENLPAAAVRLAPGGIIDAA